MKEVPVTGDKDSRWVNSRYSEIIAQFLSNPSDIYNNMDIKRMEQNLELTLSMSAPVG